MCRDLSLAMVYGLFLSVSLYVRPRPLHRWLRLDVSNLRQVDVQFAFAVAAVAVVAVVAAAAAAVTVEFVVAFAYDVVTAAAECDARIVVVAASFGLDNAALWHHARHDSAVEP